MRKNKSLRAIVTLVGTTIGAGIFGIPYVIAKVGFLVGIGYLLAFGLVILLLNLIYGEVILRTPGDHQLSGYGEIYLGKPGKFLALVSLFIGLYGALLAYLIKIGEFLALIFGLPHPLLFSLLFFILAAGAIFFGLRTVSTIELLLVSLILGFILILTLVGLPHLAPINYQLSTINYQFLLLPYGVILFAMTGSAVIPEMEEILRRSPRQLKKAIASGTLIPLLTYCLFAFIVVGIAGQKTSEDAISGLVHFLPSWIVNLGAILGILTMGTSFLTLGFVLRETWYRDLRVSKLPAFLLAVFPPLILFLLGARSFIQVLKYNGALMGSLSGILITLLFLKAKKEGQRKPAYSLNLPLLAIAILSIILFLGFFSPFLS